MTDTTANNKRIAKNTLMLYIRMLIMMAVSLYTSRVVLQALGVTDFGIYNAVGGLVAMFGIISNSLSSSISRFITFELGTENTERLKTIFSTSIIIQLSIAIIIILLAETLGIWFLNAKMTIPPDRMTAANWVFQFSILTFAINLISVPYNALIIAHERMSAFAYISILEAFCKLGIAFLIMASPIDKLTYYAALMMISAIIIRFAYSIYCKRHFPESKFHFILDKNITKEMYGFAGWNFIGASSAILRDQGGNILLNIFFGPAANAARGISMQVNNAVTSFVQNFTIAINPQIIKSYANGENTYLMNLLFKGSRFSFYLLTIISLPILIETQYILSLWLGTVPTHSDIFVQLIIAYSLNESISAPLVTAMLATGKIRNYQIIVGGLQMLNIPVSYVCLKCGMPPESVFTVAIIISLICLTARLAMLKKMISLPIKKFITKVYLNAISVIISAAIIPVVLTYYLAESSTTFILQCLVCIICSSLSILFLGCNSNERNFIYHKALSLIKRLK